MFVVLEIYFIFDTDEKDSHRKRKANGSLHDPALLQQEGAPQGIMPGMFPLAGLRPCATGYLRFRRTKDLLQTMPLSLLPTRHARKDATDYALLRPPDDLLFPPARFEAFFSSRTPQKMPAG